MIAYGKVLPMEKAHLSLNSPAPLPQVVSPIFMMMPRRGHEINDKHNNQFLLRCKKGKLIISLCSLRAPK